MTSPFIEHSFSLMVEKVSDYAIFLTDPAGVILTWNPAAQVMKGYSRHEAVGRHLAMLYIEEDQRRDHPRLNLAHAAEHGTFQESAWRRRKDGSLFWALIEIIAIRNEQGELDGFCKLTRDLTNLKELQDKLAAQMERVELTLCAIADGVISADDGGVVEYVNSQAQRLTGWSQRDALGVPIETVLDMLRPDAYSADENRLVQSGADETRSRSTGILQARDGARHVIEMRKTAIPERVGRPGGTVIAFHDAGDRRRMEEALRDADRRKDEFLAMLAHELRNPLAPVSAAAKLLSLGILPPEAAKKASQVIIRQVRHMTELVDDLLDVSRVSRGEITLTLAALDMKMVVGHALEQVRPLIESRQHTLSMTLAPARAYVKGDEKRLIQVVANILNNAAKYTPPGGKIGVEMTVNDSDVCVEVTDNGIGIEPAVQKSVFEMFEQAHRTSDRAMGGLGIGLALVHSLAHLHGGSVACHSDGLGHGSRFRICIPRLAADETVPERRATERLADLPVASVSLSVMIVDDNVDAAEMLQFFLTTAGHRVRLAHTAAAALDELGTSSFDVCILDIGLPDGNGHDLARDIRALTKAPPTLIALTGFGTARDRERAAGKGFDHYFVKPVELQALSSVLADVGTAASR